MGYYKTEEGNRVPVVGVDNHKEHLEIENKQADTRDEQVVAHIDVGQTRADNSKNDDW